ncbi:hypothetical protein [Paracoccus benzoatiresistens]|uniref:Alpha/beta hydrolase n=1 Tax=Paracoccus benzoatiresistens TaxID=2997341 RepID=A0ABT4J743_9RHOB|nr:hypothetical protein [Paracoccus sp. EF6]MCZ0962909.1 hypothetical protein [Paracoccus sp. EF6]
MALNLPAAPQGKQTLTVEYGDATLKTYTYRPDGEIKGILLDLHGASRNAEGARDAAIDMADDYGLYVVSPLFDEANFSSADYQRGGLTDSRGNLLPEDEWTISLADDIAEWAHAKVGNPSGIETIAFGHSGGGQFMSRLAAYGPDEMFDKIIVANPSTHVRASLDEEVGYGFDGFGTDSEAEAALRDYLADPVTIYLGSEDNDPDAADLATGSAAMRQGDTRLERGEFVYEEAKDLAEENGWEFNWELVVADGVSHSARQLFNAQKWQEAFDGWAGQGSSSGSQSQSQPDPNDTPTSQPHSGGTTHDFNSVDEWDGAVISDYEDGDVFDFRDIDAQSVEQGDQDFDLLGFVGSDAFTQDGAEIRLRHADGDTYVYLNTDDDTGYEAKGVIEGTQDLTADNFLL